MRPVRAPSSPASASVPYPAASSPRPSVEVRAGVAQLQWFQDARLHEVGEGEPSGDLDDQAEQPVSDVRVLEVFVAFDHLPGYGTLLQFLGPGKRPAQGPGIGLGPVAGDPRGVEERFAHSHVLNRAAGQRGQPLSQGVLEAHEAFLARQHHGGGGEGLGVRGDPDQVPVGHRLFGVDPCAPAGEGPEDFPVHGHCALVPGMARKPTVVVEVGRGRPAPRPGCPWWLAARRSRALCPSSHPATGRQVADGWQQQGTAAGRPGKGFGGR